MQLIGVHEEVAWQFFDQVPPQDEHLKVHKALECLVGHLADLVALQFELSQPVLVLKRPVTDGHNFVVAQVHLDKIGQEPVRKKLCQMGLFYHKMTGCKAL